jgi:CRISPR-associated protein Csm1
MDDAVLNAALAGLARGMADFWPVDIAAPDFGAERLTRAERLVRGAEAVPGQPAALHSIFSALTLPGRPKPPAAPVLPYAPLALNQAALFPVPAPQGDPAVLRDHFQAAVRSASSTGTHALLETALDAAMCYAWCVPARGYGAACDVSRYDHARSTAAVAACLASGDDCALVGADLSGIQSFIYTLASSGAARSLRARSFYVQLLTEAIARDVLGRLGLPSVCALYIGGGGFQLLAPGRCADQLAAIEPDVQRRLLAAHRSALGVVVKAHRFDAGQFDRFGQVREALGRALNAAKRRPFAAVPADLLAQYVGVPLGTGGDQTSFCRVTGEELPPDLEAGHGDAVKSAFVESLERLGLELRSATHLLLRGVPPAGASRVRDWRTALAMFGLAVSIVKQDDPPPRVEGSDPVWLARLTPEGAAGDAALRAALGRRPVLAFYYPFARLAPRHETQNRPLMFDELAARSTGLQRWAVLRMDVDNLGALFRGGFGPHPALARAAGLSFLLRLFFEGWLPRLAEQQEGLAGRLYIQYAGGDDVFVVGAWDAVAEYALRIRESFRQFTAHNPSLTLSAGIVLADANFPLYQAARTAGDAEEAAKRYARRDTPGDARGLQVKDAVSFLEQVVGWDDFAAAFDRARDLADWCGSGLASRSLLQVLQQLNAQAGDEHARRARNREPKRQYTRTTWLAAYQLTRVAEALARKPDAQPVRQAVEGLRGQLVGPQARTDVIALAARWAQFLIRAGSKET